MPAYNPVMAPVRNLGSSQHSLGTSFGGHVPEVTQPPPSEQFRVPSGANLALDRPGPGYVAEKGLHGFMCSAPIQTLTGSCRPSLVRDSVWSKSAAEGVRNRERAHAIPSVPLLRKAV